MLCSIRTLSTRDGVLSCEKKFPALKRVVIGVSIVDVGFKKEVARALLSKELDVLAQKRGIVVEYNFWIHTWIR